MNRSQQIWLVAEREILARVRSKAFLISTALMLAGVLASVIISGLLADRDHSTPVAAVGPAAQQIADSPELTVKTVNDREQGVQLLRDGTVDAVVISDNGNRTGLKIIAEDSSPDELVALLSVKPSVELLDRSQMSPMVRYFAALAFGVVFFISAVTFGGTIAQSVVEEKQTRIVEILLSTIPASVLLTGKIIGNSLLAFGQVVLLGACAVVGLTVTGDTQLLGALGAPIAWFVVFFVIGFVLLAAMYAAAASLVSRQEDVQSVLMPVTMLVMIPYFLVIFLNDNDLVITIMSYVPFSAAVGMPFRMFVSDAAWWEPLLSLLILIASTAGVIAIASRIYRNALLRVGARVTLRDALHGSDA
ncbi:ABC transporter permease [Microlunatus soli]|uniref:ABC-2 type transport system permease protein n=1 Tax=Microlunatus soli TaxID=630515 RepID=A0A1H1T090_9ACTN|nr:ABC transporter permease [Microlunatus soli]SDS53591.1 ABC-2 type transport system permease protein [Microlunatus soli]